MEREISSKSEQREKLLRLPSVMEQTGLGKSSIYEKVRSGEFPAPVKLSRRAVCWPASSIDAWIKKRIDAGGK